MSFPERFEKLIHVSRKSLSLSLFFVTRCFFLYPDRLVTRVNEQSEKLPCIRSVRSDIRNLCGYPRLSITRLTSESHPEKIQMRLDSLHPRNLRIPLHQLTESYVLEKPGIRKPGLPPLILKADSSRTKGKNNEKGTRAPVSIRIARFFSSDRRRAIFLDSCNSNTKQTRNFYSGDQIGTEHVTLNGK